MCRKCRKESTAKKHTVPPKRKLYIALRRTRESRRCVNRKESGEENTRHHQPASSWLRNSQASSSVPRKLSTGNSEGAVVAGSGPLLLSPSQLLTDAACWQGHGGTCNVFGILLGHISFSIKITAVFQLFPSEGISFPWTEARCFLSAACTPLHHLSFPGGPWLCLCSRKGLPPSLGDKRAVGSWARPWWHQEGNQPSVSMPGAAWLRPPMLSVEAEQFAPQPGQHAPTSSVHPWLLLLVCVCLYVCTHFYAGLREQGKILLSPTAK